MQDPTTISTIYIRAQLVSSCVLCLGKSQSCMVSKLQDCDRESCLLQFFDLEGNFLKSHHTMRPSAVATFGSRVFVLTSYLSYIHRGPATCCDAIARQFIGHFKPCMTEIYLHI